VDLPAVHRVVAGGIAGPEALSWLSRAVLSTDYGS